MKSYSFSMEKVLEWREDLEKTSMEKFATAQNDLYQEKLVLDNLIKEYEVAKEKTLRYKNINEMKQLQLYKQNIEDNIEYQISIIEKKTIALEKLRLELVAAQKDRKIMEKLKEKDFNSYQDNMRQEEQKFLDEMAVLKFKKVEN